jgi:GH35 family endo-1,4-beta-xylanase
MSPSRFCLLLAILAASAWVLPEDAPQPTGRRLRTIVAEKFPGGNVFIGAAAHGASLQRKSALRQVLAREFSYVTPANDFKQQYILPTPESAWKWDLTDWWLKETAQSGQVARIHGPISPQWSKWAMEDSRTAEELRPMMVKFLTETSRRWNAVPHILWMDVVNEILDEDGQWFGPKPGADNWENPWPLLGEEAGPHGVLFPVYIKEAFVIAQKEAPRLKKIINEHALTPAACAKMKAVVHWLRGQGLKVDGVGWQAHLETGWERGGGRMELLDDYIAWAHEEKLEFHITEFQAGILSKKEKPNKWNKNPAPVSPEERLSRQGPQADTFEAILRALLAHRHTGVVAMNYWHLTDAECQDKDGNMFEEDLTPKPAYYRVQALLEKPPMTK